MTAQTPLIPAKAPDGWRLGFSHYRNYVFFAATSIPMALGCTILLFGLAALGRGEEAWNAYLAALSHPLALIVSLVILIDTLYFAFRFGWVGRKIPAGLKIGPIPLGAGLPMPLLGVAPLGGFVTLWLVLLAILGGLFP